MIIAGRYELDGTVSRGGMSEVHFGTDLHLDRRVVLKCLQPFQDIRRIVDEQKALLQVSSKHVVRLLDVVTNRIGTTDYTFLVIEFIDGEDLALRICEPDKNYLEILWQIAVGISEIHDNGIIHRDIKPQNVRKDTEGILKIFDFGLAREEGVNDKTKGTIGTLAYMAPELIGDDTISFSSAADVYAFGVLALTILDRDPPIWCRRNPPLPAPADAVEKHVPELESEVKVALQSCLEVDPGRRPGMTDVCKVIEGSLLSGKHRAQLILEEQDPNTIDETNPKAFPRIVNSSKETVSGIEINYTGSDFVVAENVGGVKINNITVSVGHKLQPSCVIEFPTSTAQRSFFATFNVSKPEVRV